MRGLIGAVTSRYAPTNLSENRDRLWLLHTAGGLTLLAWSILAWSSHRNASPLATMFAVTAFAWVMLALAARAEPGRGSRATFIWGIAFRLVALFAIPVLEDDHHRFLWDGYRFATTGNPYGDPPANAFGDPTVPEIFRPILDGINHPDVPTIYGPACEWAFRISHAIAPAQLWPWKLMLLFADITIVGVLWSQISPFGRLLLAWCPLAIFETGFNAHPDALAIALLIAAWRFNASGWLHAAATAAGLAVAARGFAILLVPFLGHRWPWHVWLAAGIASVALYVPFWMQGSPADLAGLQAMGREWEFNSSGFALVQLAVGSTAARAVCGLGFATVWLMLLRGWWLRPANSNSTAVIPPGDWIYGSFLFLSATANPWYFLWLWPFLALRNSAAGIGVLAAVELSYLTGLNLGRPELGNFEHPWWVRPLEFGSIVVGLAWCRFALPNRTASHLIDQK